MTTTRTRTEALEAVRAQAEHGDRFDVGMCLQRVRLCYGIPARYPDASSAWRNAEHQHREHDPRKIPAGVPIFWTGGRNDHGHIAIKAGGRGSTTCWSTDIRRPGHFDRVPVAEIAQRWGLKFEGWTEDLNGVRVYTPPPPKLPSTPNRVMTARRELAAVVEGLEAVAELLAATPTSREVVHRAALTAKGLSDSAAELLRVLPRS